MIGFHGKPLSRNIRSLAVAARKRCTALFALGLAVACAQAAPFVRNGNVFTFEIKDGAGEIEFASASTFRVTRSWASTLPKSRALSGEAVDVTATDLGQTVRLATRWLTVDVEKSSLKIAVKSPEGLLVADAEAPRKDGTGIVLERISAPDEQFYGLGPRASGVAGLRGTITRAAKPLLFSSNGYGEFLSQAGGAVYDLARSKPDRRTVKIESASQLQYFVYYGPTPKEILAEHSAVHGAITEYESRHLGILERRQAPKDALMVAPPGEASWTSLREAVRTITHASYSGYALAAFDLSPYEAAGGVLFERAAQTGSLLPVLLFSKPGMNEPVYARTADFRRRLYPYLGAYAQETRQYGYPVIRPLGMQFPRDATAAAATDSFMLGDELLVAPVLSADGMTSVYLPMGTWTELHTGELYKGRQTLRIKAASDRVPVFARTGSIVPLASAHRGGPIELHYYPSLPAEFFIFEEELGEFSQYHAGPAGDLMRLEMESKVDREHEWFIHHAQPCRGVNEGEHAYREASDPGELSPGTWRYDRAKAELRIRCRATAGADQVLSIR